MRQTRSIATVTLRNYASRLLKPTAWIGRADDLLRTADLLIPAVKEEYKWYFGKQQPRGTRAFQFDGPIPTFFMLTAFALENLLKAALISQQKEALRAKVERDGKLPKLLSTHDLYQLMDRLGVAPTEQFDEILVRRLTRAAEWYGRYPVPVTYRTYNTVRYANGKQYSLPTLGADDLKRLARIIHVTRRQLMV